MNILTGSNIFVSKHDVNFTLKYYWTFTKCNRWWRALDKDRSAEKTSWKCIFRESFLSKIMISERRLTICHLRNLTLFSLMLNRLCHGRLLLFTSSCQGSFCLSRLCASEFPINSLPSPQGWNFRDPFKVKTLHLYWDWINSRWWHFI